jgi:hypothetical protein
MLPVREGGEHVCLWDGPGPEANFPNRYHRPLPASAVQVSFKTAPQLSNRRIL